MLTIRLQRTGRKHEPTFRVVLTDSKNGPKSGKFLEVLGSYDARDKNTTKINGEKVKHWLSKGAKASDTVHNLLVTHKIIDAKKINVLPKKTPIIKEAPVVESKPEAAPAPEVAETKIEEVVEEAVATETPEVTETVEAPVEEAKTEEVAQEVTEEAQA